MNFTWHETNFGWEVKLHGRSGRLLSGLAIQDDGMIEDVWVHPGLRRRGIATLMLSFAQERCPVDIWHDPKPSPDGQAWIKSLAGGPAYAGSPSGICEYP